MKNSMNLLVVCGMGVLVLLSSCSDSGRVYDTYPLAGSTGQPRDTQVAVTLSSSVDPDTVNEETFHVTGSASGAKSGQLSVDGSTIRFTPDTPFVSGETVTVVLEDGIRFRSGSYISRYSFRFVVAASDGELAVVRTDPLREESRAALPLQASAEFSTAPLVFTVTRNSVLLFGDRIGLVPGTVRVDALNTSRVIIEPERTLPAGERLTCFLTNRIAGPSESHRGYAFSFTTRSAAWADTVASGVINESAAGPVFASFQPDSTDPAPLLLIPHEAGFGVWVPGTVPESVGFLQTGTRVISWAAYPHQEENYVVALTEARELLLLRREGTVFQVEETYEVPPAEAIGVSDLNLDGDLELLCFEIGGVTGRHLNDDLSWSEVYARTLPGSRGAASIRDLNGDGLLDLFWLGEDGDRIHVSLARGVTDYGAVQEIMVNGRELLAADLDGDHLPELVAVDATVLAILPNEGGVFGTSRTVQPDVAPVDSCSLRDLDGDGVRDLLLLGEDTLSVLAGEGDCTFTPMMQIDLPTGLTAMTVADLNGDTVLDVALSGDTVHLVMPGLGESPDSFVVSLEDVVVAPGQSGIVRALLTNEEPVEGYTLTVRFPQDLIELESLAPSGPAAEAEFVIPQIDNDNGEALLGVIIEMLPPFLLPDIAPGQDQEIALLAFRALPGAPAGTYTVRCDEAPIQEKVTDLVVDSTTVYPETHPGSITVRDTTAMTFIRGDVDGSGTIDAADRTALLSYLLSNGAEPPCLDAADANDDGGLDVADAFSIVSYLEGGDPPPPPFPDAGTDPTADNLGCGS